MSFLHLNDKLSIGGGLAINYAYYFQESAVRNIDPSYGDGEMELEASDVALGYMLSALLELSEKTRIGFVYRSEVDTEIEGEPELSNLSPAKATQIASSGVLGEDVKLARHRGDFQSGVPLTLPTGQAGSRSTIVPENRVPTLIRVAGTSFLISSGEAHS